MERSSYFVETSADKSVHADATTILHARAPACAPLDGEREAPLVSVLISCYEPEPRFLSQAIESVRQQTLVNWELIIVDASLCGGSAGLFDQSIDGRIHYCPFAAPASLIAQRNLALELARGEFVAIIDADDIAEHDRLERQVQFLKMHPEIGVVGSQVSVIDRAGHVVGERRFALSHEAIVKAMRNIVPLCHPSVMYRRKIVTCAGGYCDRLASVAEDYELYSRLATNGVRFANLPDFLTRYRIHPRQIKARRLRETIRAVVGIKREYWHAQMNFIERLRMWAESGLARMPQGIVWHLLILAYYRGWPFAKRVSKMPPFILRSSRGVSGEVTTSGPPLATVRR